MKLIVGLGNPGPKYALNRHNVGFLLVDALANVFVESPKFKSEFKSETLKISIGGEPVLLCKPMTYMNLSGESVAPLMNYFGIGLDGLLVAHDEIDIPFGEIRFQTNRSPGGHNGIKSLHQHLGSEAYARLRIGVGRPPVDSPIPVHDWVLKDFTKTEQARVPDLIEMCIQGVETWIAKGLGQASSHFNSKVLN